MAIYFILFFLCLFLAFQPVKYGKFFYWLVICILLFMGIFRDFSVGADNVVYSMNFAATDMNPDTWSYYTEFEPGFALFMASIKTYVNSNYYFFMGTVFVIYMIGVNYIIQKECENKVLALFFLVGLLYYTLSFNIMRQCTALSLFCFVIPLLREKNKWYIMLYCALVLLITFYVHRSFIVMLLLPIVIFNRRIHNIFLNKKYIILILIISYVMVFLSQKMYNLIPYIASNLSFLGGRYVGYIDASKDADETVSKLSSLMNVVLAIYIVCVAPKNDKKENYKICYILGIILANCIGSMNALFLRIATNLSFFSIIYFESLWNSIKPIRQRYMFRAVIVLYCLIVFSNAIIKNFGLVVPYINRIIN